MTFKQAHKMAMNKSAAFRKQDALVRQAMETGGQTACLTFTIEGETFYYGFDGVVCMLASTQSTGQRLWWREMRA